MSTWNTFTEIDAWKEARNLCQKINPLLLQLRQHKEYGLLDQISRSSGSVMDNIAEGFGRGGNKEFRQFLFYAKGSCMELESQIIRCKDRNIITQEIYDQHIEQLKRTLRIIGGLTKYLSRSQYSGEKFKKR